MNRTESAGIFFLGFWSKSWAEIQQDYLQATQKKMNIDGWKTKAQLQVWEYAHSLWLYRNKLLHGKIFKERLDIEKADIKSRVEEKLTSMKVGSSGLHLKN